MNISPIRPKNSKVPTENSINIISITSSLTKEFQAANSPHTSRLKLRNTSSDKSPNKTTNKSVSKSQISTSNQNDNNHFIFLKEPTPEKIKETQIIYNQFLKERNQDKPAEKDLSEEIAGKEDPNEIIANNLLDGIESKVKNRVKNFQFNFDYNIDKDIYNKSLKNVFYHNVYYIKKSKESSGNCNKVLLKPKKFPQSNSTTNINYKNLRKVRKIILDYDKKVNNKLLNPGGKGKVNKFLLEKEFRNEESTSTLFNIDYRNKNTFQEQAKQAQSVRSNYSIPSCSNIKSTNYFTNSVYKKTLRSEGCDDDISNLLKHSTKYNRFSSFQTGISKFSEAKSAKNLPILTKTYSNGFTSGKKDSKNTYSSSQQTKDRLSFKRDQIDCLYGEKNGNTVKNKNKKVFFEKKYNYSGNFDINYRTFNRITSNDKIKGDKNKNLLNEFLNMHPNTQRNVEGVDPRMFKSKDERESYLNYNQFIWFREENKKKIKHFEEQKNKLEKNHYQLSHERFVKLANNINKVVDETNNTISDAIFLLCKHNQSKGVVADVKLNKDRTNIVLNNNKECS